MFKELPLPVGRRSAAASISGVRFTYWRRSSLPGVPASHEAAAQKTPAIGNVIIIFCARWTELQKTFFFHIHDPLEWGGGGKEKIKKWSLPAWGPHRLARQLKWQEQRGGATGKPPIYMSIPSPVPPPPSGSCRKLVMGDGHLQ